ncbi:MAG TPA: ABC transporter substrate-binding protein [Kofleriaceae bacterium]|nr:ABC transporter substrate-binding protein [Kofleriaceae bacterium]
MSLVSWWLILGLAPSTADAETRPRYGRKLFGSTLSKPVEMDPARARTQAEVQLASLVYDSLYRVGDAGAPVPHLAAALPALSADGREARITLRPGLRFQDGSVLDAADVAASLRRLAQTRAGWLTAPVANVTADGTDVVVIALRRPAPELAALLAAPQAAVTPSGRAPSGKRVGSGPFRVDRAGRGQIALLPWDGHVAGRPYADRLELHWYEGTTAEASAYEVGDLNLSFRGAVAFTGHQPKFPTEVVAGPAVLLSYVGFGRAHGRAWDDRDLRRALSLAIGREGLRHIGTGELVVPAVSPVAADLGGAAPAPAALEPDEAGARAALARAASRFKVLAGKAKPTFDLLIDRSRPDDREIGEKVVGALFRIGLQARLVELEPDALAQRVERGDFDLVIGQLAPAGAAPALQIAGAFAAGGDPWAAEQLAVAPLDADAALVSFADRLPILPLFHRAVRVHHRVDVRRLRFDAIGRLQYPDMFLFGGY